MDATLLIKLTGGLVYLLAGGDLLVRGAVALGRKFHVPPTIIALTVVAFGTSLPELVVVIQATLSGYPGLVLGNVIGSNIANVLLVAGLAAVIYPLTYGEHSVRRDSVSWTDLTNNKAGSGTLTTHKPSYVTGELWDSATNTIDLGELPVGTVVLVRNDYDITTGSANTRLDARLYFPDTTKSVEFSHDTISSSGTEVRYSRTTQFFVTDAIKTTGVKIQVKVDKNNATARVEDFQITILSF